MNSSFTKATLLVTLLAVSGIARVESDEPNAGTRLSGVVFKDVNENARMDEGELPALGAIVDLLDEDSKFVERALTDERGIYAFEGIPQGLYFLRFEFAPGFAVRSRGIEIGTTEVSAGKSPIVEYSGKAPIEYHSGKAPIYDGSNYVFVPIPWMGPLSTYSFTRLGLVNPAGLMGSEVSAFAP